ncbi:glycosyltransferase [Panacibacter sp. DH6]|uniref:Glycosyltransferase n=1 Tax=Panacibacter microcysteis TaxID=2793269 RepID=A0A931E8X3_9BACT|nr:glycosyltransferase [Panacibacter microcysteis]MBG9377465.1 glycosyltransferase [Panacibacter microcysteis]
MTIVIISMIRDSWGGSEELWYEMAKEALERKYKVIHLSYSHSILHPKMKELISKGLISYQRPAYVKTKNSYIINFYHLLVNFLKKKVDSSFQRVFKHNPDVVLYNGTCYSIANEQKLLEKLKFPTFSFFLLGHFNDERIPSLPTDELSILRFAYLKCKKVLFVSERSLQTTQRHLNLKLLNACVIRNPVNIVQKTIIPYPSLSGTIQMALVGNLILVHKGQDLVFNVLNKAQWKNRSWHLNIYGSGPDEDELKKMCERLGLEYRITFHGKVNDIRKVWEHNHLLLMPSHMEGMPLAVVEAMICGRPCVATDVGGITEWIIEEESGFISPEVSLGCIEAAMEKAWGFRESWEKMGIAAHQRAVNLYDAHPGKTLLTLLTHN